MNELMSFDTLSARRTEAALLRGNAVTERIELGEGILPKLAVALCDSPCVGPENWEEALGGLTELFYHFKGACGERLGDDELLRRTGAPIQRLGGRLRGPHRRSRWPRDAALRAHGKGGGR